MLGQVTNEKTTALEFANSNKEYWELWKRVYYETLKASSVIKNKRFIGVSPYSFFKHGTQFKLWITGLPKISDMGT